MTEAIDGLLNGVQLQFSQSRKDFVENLTSKAPSVLNYSMSLDSGISCLDASLLSPLVTTTKDYDEEEEVHVFKLGHQFRKLVKQLADNRVSFINVYVHVHVCLVIHVHVCLVMYGHVHVCLVIHVHVHVCLDVHVHVCLVMHGHVHVCLVIHVHVHVCLVIYVHV